jgi:N-acyl-D-amino-acid deacylase
MSSWLIRGALVIDGSNREPFRGDIAVENGMITEVSPSIKGGGKKVIEADGLMAAPGFIDIHSHSVSRRQFMNLRSCKVIVFINVP